jgi:hypothetical protein
MGNMIQYPEAESANCVPAEQQIGDVVGTDYRNAVACLYGIHKLSPRIAHRIMRKIVRIYRSLAKIADGNMD